MQLHAGMYGHAAGRCTRGLCASEPRPYLRDSEMTNTCEALGMSLTDTCAGRSSALGTE